MKKNLFFILLSFFAVQAKAGEFVHDYSFTADGFYGYSDYSEKYSSLYKHNHTPVNAEFTSYIGYEFDDDSLFTLGLDGQVSDGKELEDYNHGKWGENLYVSYDSFLGEITVGQVYNAAYQMAVGAPSVGAFRVNNSMISDFIANPNWNRHDGTTSYRTLNSTYLNTDADALKVSYVTPEFYNTKAAFSYTPDSYSKAGLINKNSRYDNKSAYSAGLYNQYDAGYFTIESSLGYAYNHKNNQEMSAGLSLYRKGWTLGGSYRRSFTTGSDYDFNLNKNGHLPYFFDGYREGKAYNIGLSYEIGPLKTGISYFTAYADKISSKDKIVSWVNRYAFNQYVAVYVATAYAKYRGVGYEKKSANEGYAIISGLELNF